MQNFISTNESVSAEVIGSRPYQTVFGWHQPRQELKLESFCSCPHFGEGAYCKHLWALALQADKLNLVPIAPGTRVSLYRSTRERMEKYFHKIVNNADRGSSEPKSLSEPQNWRQSLQLPEVARATQSPKQSRVAYGLILQGENHIDGDDLVRMTLHECPLDPSGRATGYPKQALKRDLNHIVHSEAAIGPALKTLASMGSGYNDLYIRRNSRWELKSETLCFELTPSDFSLLLPGLCASKLLFHSTQEFAGFVSGETNSYLEFTDFGSLKLIVNDKEKGFLLTGILTKQISAGLDQTVGEARTPLHLLQEAGSSEIMTFGNKIGIIKNVPNEEMWMQALRLGPLDIPTEDAGAFLERILGQPVPFEVPESLKWPEVTEKPQSFIHLKSEKRNETDEVAKYLFDFKIQYGPRTISYQARETHFAADDEKKIYLRNREAEAAQWEKVPTEQLQIRNLDGRDQAFVTAQDLVVFVEAALASGLTVELDAKPIQNSTDFKIEVSSGLDWFDVDGEVQFSGLWVKFPVLLEAARKGEKFVPLPDGSKGILSAALKKTLEKYANVGITTPDGIRFQKSQGLLLNAMLEGETNPKVDASFKRLREKIKKFSGVTATEPGLQFQGKLRKYQKEGLGWLEFLESFGLGGILADDMGLGKTIQCLAFLDKRMPANPKNRLPNLLIAPKSLLSNWRSEANKFTPRLRVHVLAGIGRQNDPDTLKSSDLVVTTYQTMLRDFDLLKSISWDCLILDEAQAIKNPNALIAKASKSLPAKFKLAMTGTPIENSIQDLFSISDFVNPGFLNGKARTSHLKISPELKGDLSRALRPVILRRKKEMVLKDLPSKVEQVVMVDLEPKQQRAYNELKKYYQSQLLTEVQENGLRKSQIKVLAALTRLRQAALHPGLISPAHEKSKSAKFEVLLEMLEEILSEGHKVLVFSQFTSLLTLLKTEFAKHKIKYCYLDGKTTNRKEVVGEFKTGKAPVFLMSLKAGGVGLNLVEADYVFLLDPWWNPAAEAQAIDRVHRIGQTRSVNAYRFIAKGTVEEKILELQKAKRDISDEMLDGQSSLMRNLTTTDLENLLS